MEEKKSKLNRKAMPAVDKAGGREPEWRLPGVTPLLDILDSQYKQNTTGSGAHHSSVLFF